MQVKIILVNFQEEYLTKRGKWYTKNNIDKFVLNRLVPFCDRHQIPYYMIKSDYSSPNRLNRDGCIPQTDGFKSYLIKLSKLAGEVFVKADDSPNFVREAPLTKPVEKPSEFKKWLDNNIGDPAKLEYVILAGVGIEASITLVGNELARYGYKVRVLKEGSVATNKKFTAFYQDKFPISEWGETIAFSKFITEYSKFIKKPEPESSWRPSEYVDTSEEDASFFENEPETEPEPFEEVIPEKKVAQPQQDIQIPTNLSKNETIALMKQQMKAQAIAASGVREEPIVEPQPEEEPIGYDFKNEEPAVTYDFDAEPVVETPVVQPVKKSLKEEQQDALEAARRRVMAFYGDEPEPEPTPEPKPEPKPTPAPQPVREEPEIDIFVKEEAPFVVPAAKPVEKPKVTDRESDEYRYANVYNSMIEIDNEYYDNASDSEPIGFIKSKIYGEGGKKIKPKSKPGNKMSVHEKYVLLGEQKRKAYALRGEKYKPDNGVDESLR